MPYETYLTVVITEARYDAALQTIVIHVKGYAEEYRLRTFSIQHQAPDPERIRRLLPRLIGLTASGAYTLTDREQDRLVWETDMAAIYQNREGQALTQEEVEELKTCERMLKDDYLK